MFRFLDSRISIFMFYLYLYFIVKPQIFIFLDICLNTCIVYLPIF